VKARAEKANPYELLGRARKTAHIVLAIEDRARELGEDPLGLAGTLSDSEWREVAVCAGQYPPSDKTKAAVLEMLEERARKGAA
jgi:hypothetical protein